MRFDPKFIPKERKKVNYFLVVPFIVLSAILTFILLNKYIFTQDEKTTTSYRICNLSEKESLELVSKSKFEFFKELKDYGIYGDSFGLYHEEYTVHKNDLFDGKTFFLKNLCYEEEDAYMMDRALDRKLPVWDLKNGFYEIEVLEGLDRFHLFSEEKIDEVFYTSQRSGHHKKIRVISDKDLFLNNSSEPIFDRNIVYLEISEEKANKEDVSIILDPGRLTELWEGYIDYGSNRDTLVEAHEMYDFAVKVQENLAKAGYPSLILRDHHKARNYFGDQGRLEEIYKSKANYLFQFNFPSSNFEHDQGVTVLYSPLSSNAAATTLMKQLQADTKIKASNWTGKNDIPGVYPNSQDQGLDNRMILRETGGKFSGSGLEEESPNPLGKKSRHGLQTIVVEYGYMSSDYDFSVWKNEKDKIAKSTADAIIKIIGAKSD